MSRFTNDVDIIGEMLNSTLVQIFSGTITLIGTLALMLYTNMGACGCDDRGITDYCQKSELP